MKQYKRTLITSALPYANGPVHIGHLAGVYVPADIYARYLRMKGEEVAYIGGSDEHGVPITLKAKNEGVTSQDIVDKYHGIIKDAFSRFGISFDVYSRTSAKIHHETASEFFKKLHADGKFVEKTTEQYFDEEAKQWLADRYITGTCPKCSNEKAFGDQCEACGSSLNATDLINPKSVLSGNVPVLKETKHWYLPLDQYEPWLKEWILEGHKEWKSNVYGQCKSWIDGGLHPRAVTRDLDWGVPVPVDGGEGKVLYVWFDAPIGYISATKEMTPDWEKWWKSNVYGQCKSWIDGGLHPRAVTRDLDWGVPVPVDGGEGKVLYVWFDAPIGYISATKEMTPDWEKWWKDEDTRMLHFIGKDNIVFHCIIFPSMLKAEGSYNLPENVPANEFLNLEGDKISTSRNWAVWLHEYLEEFPGKEDVLKYVLTANAPETKDNDFTWKDFQTRNNNELVAVLGNFVNRALVLTQKYYQGEVPAAGELQDIDKETLAQLAVLKAEVEKSLDSFRFREALKLAMDMARLGNKYLADMEPWKVVKTDEERVKTIMNTCLQITANLTVVFEPFLPFTVEKLRGFLNMEKLDWTELGRTDLIADGHMVNKPELLFEKIEDKTIEAQVNKLLETKKANEMAEAKAAPVKENCSFEDFTKMDIRVGTIIEAEKVAKTKKLLKLLVDTGIDQRTVVSGIAEYYKPEDIIGKQVSILVNLEPRKLRGIESQGMILMAEDADGTLKFVSPIDAVKNGSEIK